MTELVSERLTIKMATARSLNDGRQLVEANGLGCTLHSHPQEPRRSFSYKDFINSKPRDFYGNEGVVGLAHWFEKVEDVFDTCYWSVGSKVCFAACTLMDRALA